MSEREKKNVREGEKDREPSKRNKPDEVDLDGDVARAKLHARVHDQEVPVHVVTNPNNLVNNAVFKFFHLTTDDLNHRSFEFWYCYCKDYVWDNEIYWLLIFTSGK